MTKICQECKVEILSRNTVFCSWSCRINYFNREEFKLAQCVTCGNPYKIYKSIRKRSKFCSFQCHHDHKKTKNCFFCGVTLDASNRVRKCSSCKSCKSASGHLSKSLVLKGLTSKKAYWLLKENKQVVLAYKIYLQAKREAR